MSISGSKSTDKLVKLNEIVETVLTNLSQEKTDKLKSIVITWAEHGTPESVVCPNLNLEFYE